MKKKIKDLTLIVLVPLLLVSCNRPKIDRIHIFSEGKCYILQTNICYAGKYVYANGERYRRNDVAPIEEGKQCPYCLGREVVL